MGMRVAAVGEPAGGVAGGDGGEGVPGRGAEVVIGASTGAPEGLLDLGERFLDRIEVGRIGRERQEAGAASLDSSADARVVVGGEVVGDNDLSGAERRGQAVADVAQEAVGRHRPIEAQDRADAGEGQRGDEVLFSPRLAGAVAWARWPRGARAWVGVYPRWLPVSSRKTRSSGRTVATSSRQAARTSSLRSLAPSVFFSRMANPT